MALVVVAALAGLPVFKSAHRLPPPQEGLDGRPVVESRGWVEPGERDDWHAEVADEVAGALAGPVSDGERGEAELVRLTRRATGRLVSRRTGRRPTLVPVVEVR